ncbi:MAG TPA: universal stress protein [Puia sp.]
MKSILILTDFSEESFRAAEYGCEMARLLQVDQIVLFHAYQTVVSIIDIPLSSVENNVVIHEENMGMLAMQQERLKPMAGDIRFNLIANDGFLPEGINQICYEEGVELIVMGVSGKSGFERTVLGSTTARMLENIEFPLLIVPAEAVIGNGVKSVVFASTLKNTTELPMLRLFAFLDAFKPSLAVVNVETPAEQGKYSPQLREGVEHLQKRLAKYQPAFYYIEGDDVVESLLVFAAEHKSSMIIGVPEKHGVLSFHKSVSKKLAYNSKIPFLALPAIQKTNPAMA